ncbi:hypothetical protein HYALB_00010849 [Hymenoscyphus albidus]|uniref:Alcohol acetyltransferase n=1 Tax=Hymenoscyphus albidus TaxID=595503 RepID=A0A9N9LHH0_9HELO|nr:hypothetical protein HYALB_00010849 [Hymenoscyphus albidus]
MEYQTATVDLAKLEKVRPLGKMEEFSSARYHLDLFKNVGITNTFTFTQTSSLFSLKDLVFYALTNVLQKNVNLSTIVVDRASDAPYFARLPVVNLEKVVKFLERKILLNEDAAVGEELDDLLEIENNTSFKSQYGLLPLWRLVILSHLSVSSVFTASFFFHHALGDGTSALVFLSDFQEGLNSLYAGVKASSVLFKPEKNSILPSLEALLPHPYIPSHSHHPENLIWTGECNRAPTSTCGKFHTLVINKETSLRIFQACKVHKTTITALLTVLVANSLFQILPERYTQLDCTIPVNIRNLLSLDKTSFGVYIDALNLHLTRREQENFNWAQVIQVKTKISEYFTKAKKGKINVAGFENIPSMIGFFQKRFEGERNESFDVSHLGAVKSGGDESWTLGRTVFSRSVFVSGAAVSVGVVTGGDGCMRGVVEEMIGNLGAVVEKVVRSELVL